MCAFGSFTSLSDQTLVTVSIMFQPSHHCTENSIKIMRFINILISSYLGFKKKNISPLKISGNFIAPFVEGFLNLIMASKLVTLKLYKWPEEVEIKVSTRNWNRKS